MSRLMGASSDVDLHGLYAGEALELCLHLPFLGEVGPCAGGAEVAVRADLLPPVVEGALVEVAQGGVTDVRAPDLRNALRMYAMGPPTRR